MDISPELLEEIVVHVREDPTVERCGIVAVAQSPPRTAMRVYRARNIHDSPLRFEIDPRELLELWRLIESEEWELGAIYHSHVRSRAYPSQTDINFAANWPGVEWIIVGISDPQSPEIRSFSIEEGVVQEVRLSS